MLLDVTGDSRTRTAPWQGSRDGHPYSRHTESDHLRGNRGRSPGPSNTPSGFHAAPAHHREVTSHRRMILSHSLSRHPAPPPMRIGGAFRAASFSLLLGAYASALCFGHCPHARVPHLVWFIVCCISMLHSPCLALHALIHVMQISGGLRPFSLVTCCGSWRCTVLP